MASLEDAGERSHAAFYTFGAGKNNRPMIDPVSHPSAPSPPSPSGIPPPPRNVQFLQFFGTFDYETSTQYISSLGSVGALLQSLLVDPSPKPKTYCKPLSVCQSALHIIPFWGRDFIRSDYHYLGARLLATPALWLIFHSSHQPVGIPQCVTVGVQLRLSRLAVTHLRCQFRAGTPATARSMEKRLVWTERVWMGGKAAFIRGDHWAVRIGVNGEDCHEVSQTGKSLKQTGVLNIRSSKNEPIKGTLALAGVTMRTDEDIHEFNKLWNKKYEKYKLLSTNCQKFARDLLEFLVGGSYQPPCPLPQASLEKISSNFPFLLWDSVYKSNILSQASVGSWFCTNGHFEAESKSVGFRVRKQSAGKAGVIFVVFGVEVEGPKLSKGIFTKPHFGNLGPFAEASLFRIEAKIVPLRVRFEPNLNSGVGMKDGQGQVSLGLL